MNKLPPNLETLLRKKVVQHDLTEYADKIRAIARLTFLLRVQISNAKRAPLGGTRLGGTPDLPADWKWPVANERRSYKPDERQLLTFIAQVNFAEVPSPRHCLPKGGILYFFANEEEGKHRLLYHKGGSARLVRHEAPADELYADSCVSTFGFLCVKKFVPSISLPTYEGPIPKLTDEAWERYHDLAQGIEQDATQAEPSSRLLGYPFSPDENILPRDWELLLEAQSFFGPEGCLMNFGDAGSLAFMAPIAKIAKADFSKSKVGDFSH